MAEELERIYTVPLRNASLAPRPKRAKRAVTEVKTFLARHMKAEPEKIWIDNPVNEIIWARGIQKPPRRIRVRAIKFEDGVVEVSLPDSASARRVAEEAAAEKKAEKAAAAPAAEEESTEKPEGAAAAAAAPAAEEESAEKPAEDSAEESAAEEPAEDSAEESEEKKAE